MLVYIVLLFDIHYLFADKFKFALSQLYFVTPLEPSIIHFSSIRKSPY